MPPMGPFYDGLENDNGYGDNPYDREQREREELARRAVQAYQEAAATTARAKYYYNPGNYMPWETPPTRPAPDKPPVPATQHAAVQQELTKVREDLAAAKRELELAKSQATAAKAEAKKAQEELKKFKDSFTNSELKPGHRPIELD